MNAIKLSICVISLASRHERLQALINLLAEQPRFDECELIVIIDSGQQPSGAKRNRTLGAAAGDYVVCIDDDDTVALDYIPAILEAIDAGEPVDAILINGVCTQPRGQTVFFNYELDGVEGRWADNEIWRSPGHLCPIRTGLATRIEFPQPSRGEDLAWSAKLRPLIKTARRAVSKSSPWLYHYLLDNQKSTPRVHHKNRTHQEIFTPQYRSKSGPGSTAGYSQPYRQWLEGFIKLQTIRSIIDLGCGDMAVMGNVDLAGAHYHGVDVIKERIDLNATLFEFHPSSIEFECCDLREKRLEADLILCKDVLQHWSNEEISNWLVHLNDSRHLFRFALITNCNYGPTINQDISTGGWRALDLTRPPFSIGAVAFSWGDSIGGYKEVVMIPGTK